MSAIDRLRQMHPYQLLLLAVLLAVVIGQGVAMAMVAQGQVEKARAFYAQKSQPTQQMQVRQVSANDGEAVAALQSNAR